MRQFSGHSVHQLERPQTSLTRASAQQPSLALCRDGSLPARVDIFFRVVGNSIDLDKFGIYTNVGNLWASHLGGVIDNGGAIDSYYASFIGNMGPMSVIVVPLIMFYILRDVGREWRGLMPLLIVYGLFSFTTIVSEAYPMNIIFPLVLSSYAYLCRARRRRYTSANESDGVVYGS